MAKYEVIRNREGTLDCIQDHSFARVFITDTMSDPELLYVEVIDAEFNSDIYYGKLAEKPKNLKLPIGQTIQFSIKDVVSVIEKE